MKKTFMRLCSLLLTIVMVINMLPLNTMASELHENSATEETYATTETLTESNSEEIEEETANEIETETEPVIEGESTEETKTESLPVSTERVEPDLETEPVIETEAEIEAESMTGTEFGLETEQAVTKESDLNTEADTELDAVDGAYIVEEIVENRTEYSKEYLLSTGLHMMTMYHAPVHYEVDGQWEEIDNTLQLSDGQYKNTEGVWDVAFPEEIDSESPVTITKDGYSLSFYMAGEMYAEADEAMMTASANAEEKRHAVREARKSDAKIKNADLSEAKKKSKHPETISEKTQSRLEYEDVYDNTDVRYDLQSNQLKESIIIGAYDETVLGYTYILRTGSLQPVLTDSGEILLYDEAMQNIVLVMPAPYLVDSNEQHSYDVAVELSSNNDGTYILTYNLPMDWMADENRQWPVVLDPAVRAESTVSNVKDRAVYSNKTSSYDDDILQLGYRDGYGVGRAYLMYETLPELSSADVIIAASISLYKPGNSNYVCPVEVHKVLNTWTSSTITWSNKPNYDNTIEDYVICEDSGTYSWDITDIVREWYEGENTGMMFKVDDASESGDTETWKQFHSSDFGSGTVPVMYIVFRNNNGLESYWDYTASSTTRAGTGYINNYTGNLTWIHEDMGFGGTRTSVTINHIYNANDSSKNTFGLGYGWRTNYHQRVYQWEADSDYYVWEDSDGTAHYFAYSSDDKAYKDEDGLELTLTATGNGASKYCIKDKNGNCSYFDTYGRLRKISNNQKSKSEITITYTTTSGYRIDTITDGASRVYHFTYNDSNLLSKLYYKGNNENLVLRSMTFAYTSSRLSTITYQDGETTKFAYETTDGKKLITKVTDIDGYNLNYTYTTVAEGRPARVASVIEKDDSADGGSLEIQYGHNQTTFTDQSGNKQMVQFNNWGNTISIQDDQGRAQYGQYDSSDPGDGGKGNQLRLSSALQNTVGNKMKSGDFDYAMSWYTSADTISFEIVSDTAYSGSKSLKATTTSEAVSPYVYSVSYAVAKKTSATFSAYVKTGAASAYLALYDGTRTVKSEVLDANSDWTRLQVTYTNDSDEEVTVRCRLRINGTGVTYMDCVQLEEATTASRFNLVANGDFRYTGCWDTTSRYTLGSVYAAPATELDTVVHKVTGSPTDEKRISQTIEISGSKGDCYVLAGWAKAASVPLEALDDHYSKTREFGIIATFNNTDDTTTTATVHFNDCVKEWQYAAEAIVAKKAYDSITIELAYDYNANTAYFDGIQLFKEQFGYSYTYDEDGNVVSVKDLQGKNTDYEYTENDLTKEVLPTGAELTYTYDDYHNVLTATTQTGVKYEFTYDAYGNNTSVSIVNGNTKITSSATYTDDGNRISTTTDAAGNVTAYGYAENTNVLQWVRYPENSEATQTKYTYDDMYYLLTEVKATIDQNNTLSANYTYSNDLLTEIKTGSTTYFFTYGNFAQTSTIMVGDQVLATYDYTNQTNYLEKLAYGNGDSVEYTYDQQGRMTKQIYEDGATVQYLYDNDGELAAVIDSETGITSYTTSDFTDRNVQYREVGDDYEASLTYKYNKNNLITKIVENIDTKKRNTTITYDGDNRVSTWKKGYAKQTYTYDAYSRVSEAVVNHTYTDKDVMSKYYTYFSPGSGLTSSLVSKYQIDSAGDFDVTYTYTYDDNGNITSVDDGTYETTYEYDSANQLTRENNQQTETTTLWTYDNAGNILTRTVYAYTEENPNSEDGTGITYTYGDSDWGDLLTGYGTDTIAYDQIGNPETVGEWRCTWKHGRELASMTNTNNVTWNYTYNADGLRTKRTDGTDTYDYVYLDGQLVKLTINDSGTEIVIYFSYDADGTPMSLYYNGTTYYYVTNLQGDVVAIVNQSGNKLVSYAYDAWGNPQEPSTTGTSTATAIAKNNPLRYRGYVYDTETGLYYLQSRYYDPEIGRFINADGYASTGQGILGNNMFAYCLNNPVAYCDTTGELVGSACAIVIASGAAIGALTGAFSAASTGSSIFEGAIEGLFLGGAGAACGLFLQGGAAVLAGAAAGAVVDVLTQGIVQYSTTGAVNIGSIDGGRVLKNAALTGLGTLIPQWGKATDDIIAAAGTAAIWADTSAVIACADVIITNTLRKESQTTSAYNKMISYKRDVILEGILEKF